MSRAQARPERRPAGVTAIAGLYAVTPDEPDTAVLARKVRRALAGGARVVQYRNKAADARLRREQGAVLLALCREAGVPLVLNDDIDLAVALGADGVHLGRDDVDIAGARAKLNPRAVVGASCYASLELALSARRAGAAYVAFGSAFASLTKPDAARAPLSLYRQARERLDCPIVAIGGITPENAGSLVEAGADAVAVVSALFDAPDIERRARDFARILQAASMNRKAGSLLPDRALR